MIVIVIVGILSFLIGASITYIICKKKHKVFVDVLNESKNHECSEKINAVKEQFLASISKELQDPMSQIITPLQQLGHESMSPEARVRAQQALVYAQDLMHRVNMLIDTRYASGLSSPDFKLTLPKTAPPKVVYVPLEKQQESKLDENAESQEKIEDIVKPDPVDEKALLFQRALERADAEKSKQTAPSAPVQAKLVTSIDDSNAAEAANMAWESMEQTLDPEDVHRFTMLVVDDAPDMCRFARDYFRGEYNVVTANNGEVALEKLRDIDTIDLVVSDITMPKMDGLELCKRIKSDLRWSHIPVILLTGRTGEEIEHQGLRLGADDYITKPFNAETLRLRVKKFIERKEMRMRSFKESEVVHPSELTSTDVDEEFIQKAIKIVEENMANSDFSVEVLGTELEMSRTYLYKKFINIIGIGPGEFVRTLRLKKGKALIEMGQVQIGEVAALVGYNTPKRFSENFKAEYGMSPSEYMKKVKKEKLESKK